MARVIGVSLLPPRWFKHLLIGSAVSFLLIAGAVVTGWQFVTAQPHRLEPVLEWAVSRLLNRPLSIGELRSAEINRDTYLLAYDVALANPDWAEEEHLVFARRLLLRINLPSIWRDGPILISRLELEGVSANLLAPQGHPASWDFWPDRAKAEERDALDQAPGFPVVFLEALIEDGNILYRDNDQDVLASISGTVQEDEVGRMLRIDFGGGINDFPFSVDGMVGPARSLVSGRNLGLDFDATLGGLTAAFSGSIADLSKLQNPELTIEVNSETSRPLLDMLGMPEVRDGPLLVQANVSEVEGTIAIVANGALEEFDLRVEATVDDLLSLDGIDMQFELDGPTLSELGYMFDTAGFPDVPYRIAGEAYRNGTRFGIRGGRAEAGAARLTIDAELPEFPSIDDWQASFQIDDFNLALVAPLLGITELPPVPYSVRGVFRSDDDGVELIDLRLEGDNSTLAVDGVVGEAPDYRGTRLSVALEAGDMARFGRNVGMPNLPPGPFTLSAAIQRNKSEWRIDDGVFDAGILRLEVEGQMENIFAPNYYSGRAHLTSDDLAAAMSAYGLALDSLQGFPIGIETDFSSKGGELTLENAVAVSGRSTLSLSGKIGDPLTLKGLNVMVSGSGPDLTELLRFGEKSSPAPLPFDLVGRVSRQESGFTLDGLKGTLAGGNLELSALLATEPDYAGSSLSVSAAGDDLRQVMGPWVSYEPPAEPYRLEAQLTYQPPLVIIQSVQGDIAGNRVEGDFSIQDEQARSGGRGSLKISGASTHSLYSIVGVDIADRFPDTSYLVQTQLSGGTQALALEPIAARVGDSDLSGSLSLRFEPSLLFQADLKSERVDLSYLLPDIPAEPVAAVEDNRAPTPAVDVLTDELTQAELRERVIPATKLDFSWLQGLEGDLVYRADKVYFRPDNPGTISVQLDIKNKKLTVRELNWDGPFAQGKARAAVVNRGSVSDFDLYVRSRRIPLLWLVTEEMQNDRDAEYRLRLKGTGANLSELAASLDGGLAFRGGGGRMNNKGLDILLGDIVGEIFDRLVPTTQSEPYTNLICHAGAMVVKQGAVELAPGLATRTDKLDLVASGKINLSNEKLDVAFNTRSRKGVGISVSKAITPYIKLGGNLANPQLALDAKGAAVSGGAAVATGGLSILAEGMWDRWVATARDPCLVLYESAEKDTRRNYRQLLEEPSAAAM